MTTALIDIGSNSVKLSIYPDTHSHFVPTKIITTGLGEGLAKTGTLSNLALMRTFDAVLQLYNDAKSKNASRIIAYATEAVRAARNGNVFVSRIFDATGLEIDVLSGETEAELGFVGAGIDIDTHYTTIDIGGASVELAGGSSGILTSKVSLPLGVLRILDEAGSDPNKIRSYINANLPSVATYKDATTTLIGIGGTATILAAMVQGQTKSYDCHKAHGYKLTLKNLADMESQILSAEDLCQDYPFLPPRRAKILLHGAILLQALLLRLEQPYLIASENGLSEGYLQKLRSSNK